MSFHFFSYKPTKPNLFIYFFCLFPHHWWPTGGIDLISLLHILLLWQRQKLIIDGNSKISFKTPEEKDTGEVVWILQQKTQINKQPKKKEKKKLFSSKESKWSLFSETYSNIPLPI